jgi:hypothetical protein
MLHWFKEYYDALQLILMQSRIKGAETMIPMCENVNVNTN